MCILAKLNKKARKSKYDFSTDINQPNTLSVLEMQTLPISL